MNNLSAAEQNRRTLRSLHWRWLAVAVVYALITLAVHTFLRRAWDPILAQRWIVTAVVILAIELVVLWHALPRNHRPEDLILRPNLGFANGLTLVCGLLLGLLGGFLFSPRPPMPLAWTATLLYTTARLIDYADGLVARISGGESRLGAILDIEFDGLGVLIVVTLAIQYGLMPVWYLPLALARQLFVAGIWLRTRRNLPVYSWPESDNRRLIAGFQTGFLAVLLWPLFGPPLTTLASVLFAIPLAFSFGRDWLVVSGRIDLASAGYLKAHLAIKQIFEGWLPLIARVVGVLLAVGILWSEAPEFGAWRAYLESLGVANATTLTNFFAALFLLALPPFLLGVVGRLAALILVGMACLDVLAAGMQWSGNAWLFVCGVIVLHLGSGRLALWRPEDAILRRQWGGRSGARP